MMPVGKALFLSYFTVIYNILEAAFSIGVGNHAKSIALIGFGLDSLVESLSGMIMIWRFRKTENNSEEENQKKETKATQCIGYTFFVLAAYIGFESLGKLIKKEVVLPTLFGMIIALVSILVMVFLFFAKVRVGKQLKSHSLIADSKQTLACIFLSVALFVGLGGNYWFGIGWLDAIIGLVITFYLISEGFETLKKKKLCCC